MIPGFWRVTVWASCSPKFRRNVFSSSSGPRGPRLHILYYLVAWRPFTQGRNIYILSRLDRELNPWFSFSRKRRNYTLQTVRLLWWGRNCKDRIVIQRLYDTILISVYTGFFEVCELSK